MKKVAFLLAAVMVFGLVIGLWPMAAWAQRPPPPEDMDWIPELDPGPGPAHRRSMPPHHMGMRSDMDRDMGMRGRMHDHPRDKTGERYGRKEMALERIKKRDPERYERITKIQELAQEHRDTDSENRKKEIERELKPLVEKELKIQQEENKKRLERLEKKLEEMKKVLKQRDQNWNEVVDYTLKEVTGQNAYLRAWRHGPGPKRK